jgi:hypothetical protein
MIMYSFTLSKRKGRITLLWCKSCINDMHCSFSIAQLLDILLLIINSSTVINQSTNLIIGIKSKDIVNTITVNKHTSYDITKLSLSR